MNNPGCQEGDTHRLYKLGSGTKQRFGRNRRVRLGPQKDLRIWPVFPLGGMSILKRRLLRLARIRSQQNPRPKHTVTIGVAYIKEIRKPKLLAYPHQFITNRVRKFPDPRDFGAEAILRSSGKQKHKNVIGPADNRISNFLKNIAAFTPPLYARAKSRPKG